MQLCNKNFGEVVFLQCTVMLENMQMSLEQFRKCLAMLKLFHFFTVSQKNMQLHSLP